MISLTPRLTIGGQRPRRLGTGELCDTSQACRSPTIRAFEGERAPPALS